MAEDAPGLRAIAVGFTADELAMLERAAKGRPSGEWIHDMVLGVAEGVVAERRDGNAAGEAEPKREPDPGTTVARVVPIAVGADAGLLERLDRLEQLSVEVAVWCETVLSELYAHTGFASPAAEREARVKAEVKMATMREAVAADIARRRAAHP
jgi:hypothetical protein